jgi:outer membrane protein TolC
MIFRYLGWVGSLFFSVLGLHMQAQNTPTLDWPEFRQAVLTQHPLARRADLYRDMAQAELMKSRGGFDLKTYGTYEAKQFDQKNYFRQGEVGLKLPTWYGLEFKTTYLLADGQFLNSSSQLPSNGQATLGFKWTLGQGLLIDQRRADLMAGRIGLRQNDAERAALLNDLLYEGAKVYWSWVVAEQQVAVFDEALRQSRLRHEALRERFLLGESPAVDTLETFIQVQNRSLDLNFAKIEGRNARVGLLNFLWLDPETPLALPDERSGPTLELLALRYQPLLPDSLTALERTAMLQHPEVRYYQAKQEILEVEQRLKNEQRKPVVDLEYNILGAGWQFFPSVDPENGGIGIIGQDIKWGVNFSYPIPNRKARAGVQLARLKLAQNDLTLRQKRRDIATKIQQYSTEYNNYAAQLTLYRDLTSNYRALLDAELVRFSLGESSVFLVNTREQRWLEARIKYLKLISEYRKTEAALRWSGGVL